MSQEKDGFIKDMTTIMGHPSGLFTLFFTEMWERFSYYGMRALLVMFLISEIAIGGWEWTSAEAGKLYGIYTGLVYVTPIFGGLIADKLLGSRKTVLIGALLMTLGHAALALETEFFFYAGLALLILGNGAFKPNISSIVGGLYKDKPEMKDGAYTIFYMGINAGAFMGILFCGYLGEKVGWSYGFGLAGVFMLMGMIQFYFGQNILGKIGLSPKQLKLEGIKEEDDDDDEELEAQGGNSRVTIWALISVAVAAGLYFLVPLVLPVDEWVGPVIVGCMVGVIGYILTDPTLKGKAKDRVTVVVILSVFTIFFWWAFEQAGSSMTVFAKNFTARVLTGSSSSIFYWVNFLLTVVPLVIITYVLLLLFKNTYKKYPISVAALSFSFVLIWGIAIWMLNRESKMTAYEVTYSAEVENAETKQLETVTYNPTIRSPKALNSGDFLYLVELKDSKYKIVSEEKAQELKKEIKATVVRDKGSETEVPASWFGILNSFFIIAFAPLFSRLWQTKLNPSAPVKFAIGLILLGLGFAILSYGSTAIPNGAETAKISMFFLIFAYLFHTLGELTLSPVGLSYVSKLTPTKLLGIIFGIWFGATAVANYLGGMTASFIEPISHQVGLSGFFLIFTIIPILAGVVLILMSGYLRKKMHGIE
ncbi:MAG: peptide MFS transporter [Flavobacteriales bacterium]